MVDVGQVQAAWAWHLVADTASPQRSSICPSSIAQGGDERREEKERDLLCGRTPIFIMRWVSGVPLSFFVSRLGKVLEYS